MGGIATASSAERLPSPPSKPPVQRSVSPHSRKRLAIHCPSQTMAAITRAVRDRAKETHSDYGYVVLSDKRHLRVAVEKAYKGFDYRIQGEGAVVMKRGLVNADAAGLGDYLLLPVHDEVVAEAPEADALDVAHALAEAMHQDDYRVPLTVGTKIVDRWGTAYRTDE